MLPPGAEDHHYLRAFDELVIPLLDAFSPEMIFVSCGFDTHVSDPLAMMCITSAGYYHMTRALREVAEQLCEGKLLVVLEGGYNLEAMSNGTEAVIRALSGMDAPEAEPFPEAIHPSVTQQVEEWLEQNIAIHRDRLALIVP